MGVIDDEPYVTHLPFWLPGAPAKRNSSHTWHAPTRIESFANGKPQLVVFPGPHTYITPSWYNTDKAVPRGTIQRRMSTARPSSSTIRKPSMPASKTL